MKHEDKKHFDVSKPRRKSPDPTSKPIIVGHHPMMPDPMILEEREKAPKPITVVSDGDEPESLTVTNSNKNDESLEAKPEDSPVVVPAEPAPEAKPEHSDEQPTPPPEVPPESAPGAIFHPPEKTDEPDAPLAEPTSEETKEEMPESPLAEPEAPVAAAGSAAVVAKTQEEAPAQTPEDMHAGKEPAPPVPAEPPAGQELHIPAGHGQSAERHKPRIWVWVAIGIIILIWVYAAVDALTNTKLPLEFFENSNQKAQQVTNIPTKATPAQTTPPPLPASTFQLPSGWTWYENKELGFKFAYPKKEGSVNIEKKTGEKGHTYEFTFSKEADIKAGVISQDFGLGADGGCYLRLGIYPSESLADIKTTAKKYLENTDQSNGFIWTKSILQDKSDSFVYEGIGAGVVNGPGDCAGFYIRGYKTFDSGSTYKGIEFFRGKQKEVPPAELSKYKKDPTSFLNEEDRQDFIKMIESATNL